MNKREKEEQNPTGGTEGARRATGVPPVGRAPSRLFEVTLIDLIRKLGKIQSMAEFLKVTDFEGDLTLNAVSDMGRVIFNQAGCALEFARELCEIRCMIPPLLDTDGSPQQTRGNDNE